MDLVKIFILIASFSSTISAEGVLSCYYEDVYDMWYLVDYYCVLNIDNDAGTDDFTSISGEHPGNLTNSEVQSVYGMAARDDSVKIVPSIICTIFTGLQKLWLDDLGIKTVTDKSFADCKNLQDLYLGYNALTELPYGVFAENVNLRILDLGHNNLRRVASLPFLPLVNLQQLHLDHNHMENLETLSFVSTPQLKILNLDENELTGLQGGIFDRLVNLEVLKVNSNKLSTINSNSFPASLVNFTEIQAAFNQISAIDLKFFDKVPSLKTASFDKNLCIDKTFEDFDVKRAENLAEFQDCGFNYESSGLKCENWLLELGNEGEVVVCLLDIFNPYMRDDFDEIKLLNVNSTSENVTIVYGESSRSDSVRLVPSRICNQFTSLVDLYLDGLGIELITTESFYSCKNLKRLYLSHNLIEKLPNIAFLWNSKLKLLDLGSNQLTSISRDSLMGTFQTLEHLYIDHNPLYDIDSYFFNSMTNLKSLWMSGVNIDEVKPGWFIYLEKLEELRLEENNIAFIAPETFKNLVNLNTLQLSYNNIELLVANSIPKSVTELHLSHNKIDAIAPNFFRDLEFQLVSFEGNVCVDVKIENFLETTREQIENFNVCFANYNEGVQSGSSKVFIAKILIFLSFILLF